MIKLRCVRVNNLKGVNLDLPYGKLFVFHGRSGSGKTSLALDTLYAEGQRRYIETFSADARRFLETQERPDAEVLDGIPPAIAVTSKTFPSSSTHTVGSATETADYLESLLGKIGTYFCSHCGTEIKIDTPQTILFELQNRFCNNKKDGNSQRIQIAFTAQNLSNGLSEWKEQGFVRAIVGNTPFRLDDVSLPSAAAKEELFIVVDRLTMETEAERFIDSLETAMDYGQGRCTVLVQPAHSETAALKHLPFSRQFACARCHHTETEKNIRLGGKNVEELCSLTVTDLRHFLEALELTDVQRHFGGVSLEHIQRRLEFLSETGLAYLTLNRPVSTLSGGEQRRIGLTPVLSSSLAGLLYVLDEPTLGLHPQDTKRILNAVRTLRDKGNTVIVVEHNAEFIAAADYLVEFGPGGGENGGNIVFHHERDCVNPVTKYRESDSTREPDSVSPVLRAGRGQSGYSESNGSIQLTGCCGNNLKHIDVSFPLGVLCTVTGVSGSGKSSLLQDTLYPALCRHFCCEKVSQGLPFDTLTVNGNIQDVVLIDAESVGRTSRANPATYLKIMDDIRGVFAEQSEAVLRCLTANTFSFNTEGGRCEHCKGAGTVTVDMQILPDITVQCPECKGKRYRPEVLEVLYRGKNVAEVLTMTAREAFSFFRGQNKVQKKLKFLLDAGLDYIQLGQPLNTLSGGELQRLKLAAYLTQIKKNRTLILMDEPTAGLHYDDMIPLWECFRSLIQTGHSLIVVEHNIHFIGRSDYVIDLGPGAANEGGRITVQGTPQDVFTSPKFSHYEIKENEGKH